MRYTDSEALSGSRSPGVADVSAAAWVVSTTDTEVGFGSPLIAAVCSAIDVSSATAEAGNPVPALGDAVAPNTPETVSPNISAIARQPPTRPPRTNPWFCLPFIIALTFLMLRPTGRCLASRVNDAARERVHVPRRPPGWRRGRAEGLVDGRPRCVRWTFSEMTPGYVPWRGEVPEVGGATWRLDQVMTGHRVAG
jgi:hypothetical protein